MGTIISEALSSTTKKNSRPILTSTAKGDFFSALAFLGNEAGHATQPS